MHIQRVKESKITKKHAFHRDQFGTEDKNETKQQQKNVSGILEDLKPVLYTLDHRIRTFLSFEHSLGFAILKSLLVI